MAIGALIPVSDACRAFCPVKVHAEETDSYLDGLSDEMDYGKLDTFLKGLWRGSGFLFRPGGRS